MKFRGLLILLGCCNCICYAQYTWQTLVNAPASWRFDDVYFLTPQKGWVGNGHYSWLIPQQFGQIWTTNDGGASWTKTFDSSTSFIRCIGFADTLNGWFGNLAEAPTTDTNFLYQTSDGGHAWFPVTNVTGPKPKGICGISVVSDSVIYAYGRYSGPAIFMKTVDKGYSWISTNMFTYTAKGLVDAWFFNKDTGILVGTGGSGLSVEKAIVLSTFDGGATWQNRYTGSVNKEICWKISFPSRKIGYISIQNTNYSGAIYVLKTTDGGLSWSRIMVSPDYYELQGVGFVNDSLGWVSGDGDSSFNFKTNDGGNTWTKDSSFGTHISPFSLVQHGFLLNRFRRFGDTLMYACGNTVYKLHAQGTDVKNIEAIDKNFEIYPNPVSLGYDFYIRSKVNYSQLTVQISDVSGRAIDKETIIGKLSLYKVNNIFKRGAYIVTIQLPDGSTVIKKLIVD